ncbi:DinB family protein [Desmospora activa]|uniref:Putative damage-inducible protein DinB n=1 Tax=Desmospora activa DSM 45169 TaxID=1121389 RepID=A0A2T4Z8R0_9BACL|nr:DinB family protein [Desmospora activa]PTM58268.1 putative damage-inducible protein DinB [Desmospora activa DSM 45169]
MDAVNTLRNVLLHEMKVGIQSTGNLLQKVKAEDWDYRPTDNMRSVKELVWHLISIPETDLTIMQEKSQEEVAEIERKYELESPDQMVTAMNEGYHAFKAYMTALSDDQFLSKETKPFYLDKGMTQASWLMETVTHLFHHRAQLFNYLKQLNYEVNMYDLYPQHL